MKQQLSNLQFVLLMVWGVLSNGFIFLPFLMAQFVTRDAWISAALFIGIAGLTASIASYFVHMFPHQSLTQSFLTALGPWLGRLTALWLLIWLYISTCMIFRNSTSLVEQVVLPLTPPYVLSAIMMIGISYAAYMGIEVLGRLSEVIVPIFILMSLVLGILALKNAHFANLTPILADGWTPVLRGAIIPWRFGASVLICLMFPNVVKQAKQIGRLLLVIGLVLTIAGIITEILVLGILGDQAKYVNFPILELVRTIEYGDFFSRFDVVYVMGVTFLLVLKLAVFQYALSVGMKELFHLKNYQSVIWGSGVAIWAGSMFFWPSSVQLNEFILFASPAYFATTIVLLPLAVGVIQNLRLTFRLKA